MKVVVLSSAFQDFTYKLKLGAQEIFFCIIVVSRCLFFSCRDVIKTESNQNSSNSKKLFLLS